jgi:hypothetical protein
MKRRPTAHTPHLPGLYQIDRLADEAIDLAEQIHKQVQVLREQDDDPGEIERDTTD